MGWVMGLNGIIIIFLVWKISDLIFKRSIQSRPAGVIHTTKNHGIVIKDNTLEIVMTNYEVQRPEIYIDTNDEIIITKNRFAATP